MRPISDRSCRAVYRQGEIHLDKPVDWPDGTRVLVTPRAPTVDHTEFGGRVIIVGFGLAGRCIADLLSSSGVEYTIIEKNAVTVETQRALGRKILQGDATEPETLESAGLHDASILALTIPDEEAVLKATSLARRLHPPIHIIARTNYSSQGMRASQLGADEVIKGEQAVALQFYERVSRRIQQPMPVDR